MSLLSRSELSVVLCPERIALLHGERTLSWGGYAHAIRARNILPCERADNGEKPWRPAMDALEAALPAIIRRNMEVSVVLSDRFMHYALIPWMDDLNDEEELVVAQHRFGEMCGDAAAALSVRVSPGPPGVPSLASAVDSELLEALAALTGRMRIRLRSIQPHLMVAYNSCRSSLQGRSVWIALLEPNSLCLGALRKGQLAWIRKLRIGEAWQEEFLAMLERESCLADIDVPMHDVMLWAPHLAGEEMPVSGNWRIQRLQPEPASGKNPEAGMPHFAFASGA